MGQKIIVIVIVVVVVVVVALAAAAAAAVVAVAVVTCLVSGAAWPRFVEEWFMLVDTAIFGHIVEVILLTLNFSGTKCSALDF